MSDALEFHFPLGDIKDLCVRSETRYFVEVQDDPTRHAEGEQRDQLTDIEDNLSRKPLTIISHENFDILYQFVVKLNTLTSKVKNQLVTVLLKGCEQLVTKIRPYSRTDDNNKKFQCRNAIKMFSFLLCSIVRQFEREQRSESPKKKARGGIGGRRGGRLKNKNKNKRSLNFSEFDWKEQKEHVLAMLVDILEYNNSLKKLWNGDSPEEHFGNLFFNTSMSALENQQNFGNNASCKPICDSIFKIIGNSISNFPTNVSPCSQLVRMLQTAQWTSEDKLAKTVSSLIYDVINNHDSSTLLDDILSEIGRLDGRDLNRDSKGTKVLSLFLIELSTKLPNKMLKKISFILDHLNQDSYIMRNGVVSVMGKLLENGFNKNRNDKTPKKRKNDNLSDIEDNDDLMMNGNNNNNENDNDDNSNDLNENSFDNSERQKKIQNDLFDLLEARVLDINSYTRSRTLQVWSSLVESRQVPAMRICHTLIELAKHRLKDKSSIVRKQAMNLLVTIVVQNPWGPMVELSTDKTQKKLTQLRDEVKAIESKLTEAELKKAHKILKQQGVEYLNNPSLSPNNNNKKKKKKKNRSRRKLNYDDEEYDSNFEIDDDSDASIMGQENKKKRKKKKKKKKNNGKREIDDSTSDDDDEDEEESDDSETETETEDENNSNENENENDNENDDASSIKSFELLKTKRKQLMGVELLNKFVTGISECASIMSIILSSKTQSDVLECIEFFKVACTFKISKEKIGFQKMLPLVWNKDNTTIINALLKAYHFKYLHIPDSKLNGESREDELRRNLKETLKVASNLVKLTYGATLADITCIEELIRLLVTDKQDPKMKNVTIKPAVFDALFSIFAGKLQNSTTQQRRGALDLLRMAAVAKCDVLSKHINLVVNVGFSNELSQGDPGMARSVCMALTAISRNKKDNRRIHLSEKISNKIWDKVHYILRGGFIQSQHWFSTAQEAINLVFSLHQRPDIFMTKVIKTIATGLWPNKGRKSISSNISNNGSRASRRFSNNSNDNSNNNNNNSNDNDDDINSSDDRDEEKADTLEEDEEIVRNRENNGVLYKRYGLAKFLFILGTTVIKLLVYIDEKESELIKKRNEKRNAAHDKKSQKNKRRRDREHNNGSSRKRRRHSRLSNISDNDNDSEFDDDDDDLNEALGGGAAEDYEIEKLKHRAEESLVEQRLLLGRFAPLIIRIITDPNQFNCPMLQSSAVLAFTKYMCVSEEFCESNLQILFTLLEKHSEPSIRANIIIALGDMAFRFPNAIDPWSHHLYKNLKDDNVLVRKNTLMVLTHLILNDMIKVKDSISEIALLLQDPINQISDLARLFFQELSKKGKNPIYNIIPDTISRLSLNDNVDELTFSIIMKFLLSFIDKEKQKENLLDKLCNRFRANNDIKSWRYIGYCISQLNFSEKLMKKICDESSIKKYEISLSDEIVYNYFKEIHNKCKKYVKPDFKETFDLWYERITNKHEKKLDDKNADKRGMNKLNKASKSQRFRVKMLMKKEKQREQQEKEKQGSKSPLKERNDNNNAIRARGGRGRGRAQRGRGKTAGKKRKRLDESSDEDEEDDNSDLELVSDSQIEEESDSDTESDEENDEDKENKSKPKRAVASRGRGKAKGKVRGRGRGRGGARGRGRGRGSRGRGGGRVRMQLDSEDNDNDENESDSSDSSEDDSDDEEEESSEEKTQNKNEKKRGIAIRGRGRGRGRARGRGRGASRGRGIVRGRGRGRGAVRVKRVNNVRGRKSINNSNDSDDEEESDSDLVIDGDNDEQESN